MFAFLILFIPAAIGFGIAVIFERLRTRRLLHETYTMLSTLFPGTPKAKASDINVTAIGFLVAQGLEKREAQVADEASAHLKRMVQDDLSAAREAADRLVLQRAAARMHGVAANLLPGDDPWWDTDGRVLRGAVENPDIAVDTDWLARIYGNMIRAWCKERRDLKICRAQLETQQLRTLRELKNVAYLCAMLTPEAQEQAFIVNMRNCAERDAVLLAMVVHDVDYDRPDKYWRDLSRGIREVMGMHTNPKNQFTLSAEWVEILDEALKNNERLEAQAAAENSAQA